MGCHRAQQAEAAAAKAAEAERAAREAAIERAEMEAAEARDRAAAAARAAESKAKLERFQAEAKQELAAKAVREAAKQEREREYNQEVMRVSNLCTLAAAITLGRLGASPAICVGAFLPDPLAFVAVCAALYVCLSINTIQQDDRQH